VSYFRLSGNRAGYIALPSRPYCIAVVRIKDAFETTYTPKKGLEEYRRLAEKCREAARKVSREKERVDLLAMANIWDLIAARVETRPQRSVTDHGHNHLAR
jgi:hypothetical protein